MRYDQALLYLRSIQRAVDSGAMGEDEAMAMLDDIHRKLVTDGNIPETLDVQIRERNSRVEARIIPNADGSYLIPEEFFRQRANMDGRYPMANRADYERAVARWRDEFRKNPGAIIIMPPENNPGMTLRQARIARGYAVCMSVMFLVVGTIVTPSSWFLGLILYGLMVAFVGMHKMADNRIKQLGNPKRMPDPKVNNVNRLQMAAPKPKSEYYKDKYIETGQLMYKYMMEDAYAKEHAHEYPVDLA